MYARLSTKGQLVVPKEIRDRHGWTPGVELEFEDLGDAVLVRRVPKREATSISDLLGCLPHDGPARTIEDMDEAVARAAARSMADL